MLDTEHDPEVLQAIFVAFSHNDAPEVIPTTLGYVTHSDAEVRQAVVLAITGYEDPRAIQQLIQLSADSDSDVRDLATFALGTQLKLDSPEIRDALAARLDDPDDDARGEAMIGLVRRQDLRAIPAIQQDLATCVSEKALEAAALSRSPELLPALIALRGLPSLPAEFLESVIADCSPA